MGESGYDVIVIGAGPGGATAAYELAQAGARTLLVEKAKLPRHKTCGGGITYKAARALPFDITPVSERVIYNTEYSWKTGKTFMARSKTPLIYMVRRNLFDAFLSEHAVKAGATVLDGTTVRSVEVDAQGARVSTSAGSFSARYLVGADGATGIVSRSLGLANGRWFMPALESDVEVDAATLDRWHDTIGLDLGELHATYGWVFPKGDHLNVGVGGYPLIKDYAAQMKKYEQKHRAARVPETKRIIAQYGYLLPVRKNGAPVQKDAAVLVGDAAGLVEAFTGEGIYWAVRSAQIAARSIMNSLATGAALDYEKQLDAMLMPNLVAARQWLHLYFWFPFACYYFPRYIPYLRNAVFWIIRGDRHFVDIRKRLGLFGFIQDLLPANLDISRRVQATG